MSVRKTGDRGDKGGPYPHKPIRVSAHLAYLRKLVENGQLVAEAVDQATEFCRRLLDSPDASERDRNNAAKTIATIAKTTADVATTLDKIERLDGGNPTDIITTFEVKLPGADD